MMKKLQNIAAIFAAGALLLGAASCSHDGGASLAALGAGSSGGGGGGGDATATIKFLSGITGGSKTAAAEDGFFKGTKEGDLDITVSDIELQLYKNNGWTKIDASASSTKNATGANIEGVTHIQGQFTNKDDAIMHESTVFTGSGTGFEMGRVKITVTTKESAVALKKISGYFASGKSYNAGYVKAGDNDYAQITGTTAFSNGKGFKVDSFEVNQKIPANSTKDVYILLGKNATAAASTGATIDVAEVVYEFAATESDGDTGTPGGGGSNTGSGGDGDTGSSGGAGGDGGAGGGEDEEPEADYSAYTEAFASVDFKTLSTQDPLVEAGSADPVQIGSTEFYAISGTSGGAITLKTQKDIMSLCTSGGGAVDKNAVYFEAKKGEALVTVSYHQAANRYVKVLNTGMDTVAPPSSLQTTASGEVKTRNIEIEVPANNTKIYLGSANSGIYITAISVKYKAEEE